MQSFDFNLIVSNAREHSRAEWGTINPSEVHRVTLTNMFWMPKNRFVLINDSMRQRLGLEFDKTLPPQIFGSWIRDILPSCGPYRTCENVYLSVDPINYRLSAIVYPALVPDLPVDFILGTWFFPDLNLKWNSKLNRIITRREEKEILADEARRQTYRNLL